MKDDGWVTVERQPGYLGKHREETHARWAKKYGPGNWRIMWQLGEHTIGFLGVCALYEDAYFKFLEDHPDILAQLIAGAREVYDDEPSNVDSGLDYSVQETKRTHIQDIAIRRCLVRMALWFKGDELFRIRHSKGTHPLSMVLSPGHVPFHKPRLIVTPELPGWWDAGSVESYYQSNKVLQAWKKDN
ncbi:MAG: hypothetical protein HY457_02990 [Parcubacteria group bacterium]|nr:hypothetical protein [Parcubacteria group bacterium]